MVDATYTGVVPDTFKDTPGEEAEVVLKGRLTNEGFHVDPNGVMAKCPSKYEEREEGQLNGLARVVSPARDVRRVQLRGRRIGGRRAAWLAAPG